MYKQMDVFAKEKTYTLLCMWFIATLSDHISTS